ncbi:MAG TPA: polysaccharide biosynthesis tyrosine autokinase [Pirellulales bacterium]
MTQSNSAQIDPVSEGASNQAQAPASNHQALMVREYDMNGLSPYMAPGYGPGYVDSAPAAGLNFTQLLHSLRRRWLLALVAGLLVGIPLAALLWLVTPENYEVVAWLRVGDPQRLAEERFRDAPEYESYRKTQAARIRSPLVLQAALNKEGIESLPVLRAEPEPRRFLEDEIIVVAPPDSELLQIKMRGKDPQQLVKIVNAVKDSYVDNVVEVENRNNQSKLKLYETRLSELKNDISAKRDRLTELQKRTNSPDLEAVKFQFQQLTQQSMTIMQSMSKTREDLAKISSKLAMLDETGKSPVPDYLIERNMAKDDQVTDLTKQVNQLQQLVDYSMGASRHPDRDPAVKDYKQKLNGAQARLEDRRRQLMPQIVKQLELESTADNLNERAPDQTQLEIQKKRLQSDLEAYQKNLDEVTAQTATLGNASSQLEGLEQEIKEEERAREKMQTSVDDVRLALQLPPRVVVLNDASIPDAPSQVFRIVVAIFGGVLGIALGSGTIVGMEYQACRLNTTGELSTQTGLRVLGTVPNLETLSKAKGLNGASALQGILAESVDSIRTMLLRQSRDDNPHVIMVSSAGDREGKTTVASHLAASLARSGRRTLLVDGDLRSPTVHAMFSASLEPGLCEMLRGEVDLEGAIQPTPVDGLMLVAAGACDYQAIAALAKDPLTHIFAKAREQFDFVIIDAAPVLTYADTLLMGSHTDAAVLSVRRDVSQLHKVHEAKERLESVGIRVLGAVVNGISETSRRPAYALPSPT